MASYSFYSRAAGISCDSDTYIDASGRTEKLFHYHPHYEMTLITAGQKYYYSSSTNGHFCSRGQIVIHTPFTFHANCPADSEVFSRTNLYFLPQVLDGRAVPYCRDNSMTVIAPPPDVFDICLHLAKRMELHQDNQSCCQTLLAALLDELRYNTHAGDVIFSRSDSVYIVDVFKYIEENLDSPLTREQLAKRFHVSINKLSNDFKRFTSMSLRQYILKYRIVRSNAMLSSGMSIQQTALACGFCDESHFIYTFKRFMKTTPEKFVAAGVIQSQRSFSQFAEADTSRQTAP